MGDDELKERAKLVWGAGDYGPTSRQLEPASEALVDAMEITPGHRVLDVAAGHGNCAIAAARRGAVVCASDFSPVMIESGRARTQAQGLEIEWQEADAADLPFDKESFDRVTSVFGAIFAPEQEAMAAEVVRVTRGGGMIGLTSWTDDGFTSRLIGISSSFGPPAPPDSPDPLRWGRREEVDAIFAALGCAADIRSRALTFRYASWSDCRQSLEAHGMAVVARQNMPPDQYEEMFRQIRELTEDTSYGEGAAIVFDSEYLEVLVAKP
jgi:ubiquinone/menaquinone biosynthesis C-methylase UbiE